MRRNSGFLVTRFLMYIFIGLFSLVGVTSVPAQNASIDTDTLTGRIVYSYEDDIYVMDADGDNIVQLTSHPAADFDPVWSPDGTRIAFRSHRDANENEEIYVMDADGSNQTNLTNDPATDYSPAWSPDGTQIAFASDRDDHANEIYVMHVDGSNVLRLTDNPGIDEYPGWSPDGTQIAFHCTFGRRLPQGEGDFEICVVNADGTGLTQLTDSPGASKLPAWSPDGTQIAFQSNRHGWPSLPEYTPLGYDADDFGEYDIYVMNADGSDQVNLTQNPREGDEFPAWSRDGDIVFSRYGCLMVMHTDGSGLSQISDGRCTGLDSGHFPDWYQPAEAG